MIHMFPHDFQEILDCTYSWDRDGCNGGWMWDAYETAAANSGRLSSEGDYPYQTRDMRCVNSIYFLNQPSYEAIRGRHFNIISDASENFCFVKLIFKINSCEIGLNPSCFPITSEVRAAQETI